MSENTIPPLNKRTPLFRPGRVTATSGALDLIDRSVVSAISLIKRHILGDFGECGDYYDAVDITDNDRDYRAISKSEDLKRNILAIQHKNGSRIMSAYRIGTTPVEGETDARPTVLVVGYWGSTDDHTSILLPSEY
ncbi:MAG: hypothetical protein AAF810_24015 [Cyanobacteria bacterium P01_D01_bin.36]